MEKLNKIREKVLFLLDAINCEDYESAKECLGENFKYQEFSTVYLSSNSFLNRMIQMEVKFKIKNIFDDSESVCVFYDIKIPLRGPISSCGLYEFYNEKISSIHLFSDNLSQIISYQNETL